MDWQNLPSSNNVEDRRGGGGGGGGGGVAIGGGAALIIALIGWFFGIDTSSITGGGGLTQAPAQSQSQSQAQSQSQGQPGQTQPTDETGQFVQKVLGSTEQVWGDIFQKNGRSYQAPRLVLFSGGVESACGQADSAVGPFYCPSDARVYLDTSFFSQMNQRLGGGGDFAYSYVIAHEVGHHVQNLLGISDRVDRAQRSARSEATANQYSVGLELQADCFAGVWGQRSNGQTNLTDQDITEAINTATAIGDDTLQRQSRGRVVPDSFTHGSAAQRVTWFKRGFTSGDPSKCDTFSGALN